MARIKLTIVDFAATASLDEKGELQWKVTRFGGVKIERDFKETKALPAAATTVTAESTSSSSPGGRRRRNRR